MTSLCQITTNKIGLLQYLKSIGLALVLTIVMSNPVVYAQGYLGFDRFCDPTGPLVTSCPDAPGMFESGSTGVDGAFDLSGTAPGTTIVFNPASFSPPLDQDGDNVYHFTTIFIPEDITVRLSAELLGTLPMVWLASGTARIDGVLDLNGEDGHSYSTSVPVPAVAGAGGWGGSRRGQPGNGPGGGGSGSSFINGGGGGHAGPGEGGSTGGVAYGNEFLLPLLGGSGGGGGGLPSGAGGGAGGGALLIASSASVIVNGCIGAEGGRGGGSSGNFGYGGGGSGGAIRLLAHTICGRAGTYISAHGGTGVNDGSSGRIRLEAFGHTFSGLVSPAPSVVTPGIVFLPANAPSVRVVRVAGVEVPANPTGSFIMPDVTLDNVSAVTIEIEASNIPPGTVVGLTITPETGSQQIVDSTPLDGTLELSTATAMVTLPHGFSRFFVQANWTP